MYAELRHRVSEAMSASTAKVADLEAQRDYMDMVCRSFASRLEQRRNLVITSVRFHRLVEEVCTCTSVFLGFYLIGPENIAF